MAEKYDHQATEKKWQKIWQESSTYRTQEGSDKPKTYVLDMFPYPSGDGLHVGHPRGYIATDIYARHLRMKGHNVLHPMGWDAFGLPAENYALANKIHPRLAVEKNIAYFKQQLSHIGFDYDWGREINTTDPAYYKWTQWIFLQLFKKGLAYQSDEPINWCPSCMTGLANEDLDDNVCERCGTTVQKKKLPQWVLKITAYADRMLADLDALRWPEHIKEAQRNWIGRSEGAELEFKTSEGLTFGDSIRVFTTRPDTLYGATYMVVAPEHPLVQKYADAEVKKYVAEAQAKTEIERSAEGKEKTGVELKGVRAINPANQEEIPIYVADYVLWGYGTGAIMAVPAHDERDYEFAKKFGIPIKQVVEPVLVQTTGSSTFKQGEPFVDHHGVIVLIKHWAEDKYLALGWKNAPDWGTLLTGSIDEGVSPEDTVRKEIAEETGFKNATIVKPLGTIHGKYFHVPKNANRFGHAPAFYVELKDGERTEIGDDEASKHEIKWLTLVELKSFLTPLSHQTAVAMFESGVYTGPGQLTNSGGFNGMDSEEAKKKIVELVEGKTTVQYKIKDWVFSRQRYWGEPIPIIHCPKDGAVAVPEKDLPVLLPEVESYQPSGTGESPLANIEEWVRTTCPTCGGEARRETNTMPQWAGSSWYYLRFMDPDNSAALVGPAQEKYWAPVDVYVGGDHAVRHLIYARFWHKFLYDLGAVSTTEPFARLEFLGFILAEDGRKMSKRYGNVINPETVVAEHGADSFRVYEMFMGPFENTVAWSTSSISGTTRFIERVWRLGTSDVPRTSDVQALETLLHQSIKKVSDDIEVFKFNTAVSQLMILLNAVEKHGAGREQWEIFLCLLAPFAPHIAEELWHQGGNEGSVHTAAWPAHDPAKLAGASGVVAVQVNGKVRGSVELATDATQEEAVQKAREVVGKWLTVPETRTVYVPGRIVNFII